MLATWNKSIRPTGVQYLDTLDPRDPKTATTIILTSLTNAQKRLLMWQRSTYTAKKSKAGSGSLLGSWILDPASYYSRAGGHGQNQMPASVAAAVLPPILRLVQFRRTKADIVEDFGPEGQIAQIGESLKPFQIVTVELDASPSQRQMMRETHNDLLPDLIKGC
jgi:hypothetical protein